MTITPPAGAAPLDDYESERGKPMPSYYHYCVQLQLQYALHAACGERFLVGGALTPATEPSTTPDFSICNFRQPDWLHDEVKKADPPVTVVEILSPHPELQRGLSRDRNVSAVWSRIRVAGAAASEADSGLHGEHGTTGLC